MSARRVAITGLGMVTPLGVGAEATWSALVANQSAVTRVNLIGGDHPPQQLAAQVPEFDIRSYVADRKLLRLMSRSDRLGLAAAQLAIQEAGALEVVPERRGAYVATGKEQAPVETLLDAIRASRTETGESSLLHMGRNGFPQVPPLTLVTGLPNGCLFAVSVLHTLHGNNTNLLGSGEISLVAIGTAYQAICDGQADWALAGGHDTGVDRWSYGNFYRLGLLCPEEGDPECAVRPLDRRRNGFALGEGGAMVVLEAWEQAQARGAPIWGEITGYAATCDATGMVSPHAEGTALAAAIQTALARAALSPEEVDYINAYASATVVGDRTELRALEMVYGDARRRPLLSAVKGALGHLLAASGAVELGVTLLALRHQVVPPTRNLQEPDRECGFDCVLEEARPAAMTHALTISRGIGGQNAVLVVRR